MSKTIKTPIIPYRTEFVGNKESIDLEGICVYMAIGFFLDTDTFYKELKTLRPFTNYVISSDNKEILEQKPYFKWHYTPIERPLQQIVTEFAELFEQILKEQVGNQKVILPLSGGLDSRTQACGLKHIGADVQAYSYSFEGGHDETAYSQKIAQVCGFPFQAWKVPHGYLWNKIENLAQMNKCYSEFTHPRQMAFVEKYAAMGEVFSLGHWGDVLFDDMGVADNLPLEQQVEVLFKKVVKKGGLELATELWNQWELEGNFKDYLYNRIKELLLKINIPESANAQIRAFKSLYWAPRWTSTNLSVFESQRPITLPYYDNRMCEFICSVPEKYLAGRQIQIEYLKMRNPNLAKIAWQSHKPFNLYNYHLNKAPYNLPYRIWDKAKRTVNSQKFIQRNWELQFLGAENQEKLKKWLLDNPHFSHLVSPEIVNNFLDNFYSKDAVYFSHPVSMLLTLSVFAKHNNI